MRATKGAPHPIGPRARDCWAATHREWVGEEYRANHEAGADLFGGCSPCETDMTTRCPLSPLTTSAAASRCRPSCTQHLRTWHPVHYQREAAVTGILAYSCDPDEVCKAENSCGRCKPPRPQGSERTKSKGRRAPLATSILRHPADSSVKLRKCRFTKLGNPGRWETPENAAL